MDGIRNLVERFVAFENLWDACEREVRAHVDAGRLAGIREAIAIVGQRSVKMKTKHDADQAVDYAREQLCQMLEALLPPASGGEKAECTYSP